MGNDRAFRISLVAVGAWSVIVMVAALIME
jgi:hypothetical protein